MKWRFAEAGRALASAAPAFLVLAFLSCASSSTNEEDVLDAVARFAEAYRRGDVATLEAMIADQYIHTNGRGGLVTREQWLAFQRDRAAQLADGRLVVASYENAALQVRRTGDVAIVVGENRASGTRDGSAYSTRLRFTQVWVLTPSGWRRAAYHDSDID